MVVGTYNNYNTTCTRSISRGGGVQYAITLCIYRIRCLWWHLRCFMFHAVSESQLNRATILDHGPQIATLPAGSLAINATIEDTALFQDVEERDLLARRLNDLTIDLQKIAWF